MSEAEAWKGNAVSGWAALHNIREVLTQLAPPGSLPDEAEFTYGPEYVHEAAVLIDAIHALHMRAVKAEQEAAELRKLLEEAAPLIRSASAPSAAPPTRRQTRRVDAKIEAYLKATAPSPRT